MKKFAFIVSPSTIKQLKEILPFIRLLPDFLIKPFLNNLKPFKARGIKIKTLKYKEVKGCIIVCPLNSEHLQTHDESSLDKIIAAGHLAKQFGAKIIGLGGNASMFSDDDHKISKKLKIAVTNGNALTTWSAFEAIYRICRLKNISLKKSTLAVIGANSALGNLCARKFTNEVNDLILIATPKGEKDGPREAVLEINPDKVTIDEDARKAIKHTDIIINTDNMPESIFDIKDLRPNTIVCDISVNYHLADKAKKRNDLTVIKGGLIKPAHSQEIISASLAETALLALENRFVNYSLSDNLNIDKTEEIANLAAKHGFEIWVPEAPML